MTAESALRQRHVVATDKEHVEKGEQSPLAEGENTLKGHSLKEAIAKGQVHPSSISNLFSVD